MPCTLRRHKHPGDANSVNDTLSKWDTQHLYKDSLDTYGLHVCTKDDPIYKDYAISTSWSQQKTSNCKCLSMLNIISDYSKTMFAGGQQDVKHRGFTQVLNFTI